MSSGGLFAQQQKQSLVSANKETQPIPAEKTALCNCKRPKAKVTCRKCGYVLQSGRARRPCEAHPKIINLMDLAECPGCRASYIWLTEFPV